MHAESHNGLRVDPLKDLEVQRALALSRARESYPSLPREVLLEYCAAAWEVAVRADPECRELLRTFDRALLTIAWTRRRSGGRVPLRDLVEQTIPRVALEPFLVPAREAADEEPEPQPALAARSGEAPPPWRSLLRVPFTSPIPVGAAVAAGVVGIALLNEARVLPIAAPQLAGNDDAAAPDEPAAPARSKDAGDPAPPATAGSGGSDLLSGGLVSDEFGDAATAQRAAVAREAVRAAAVEPEGATASAPAAREVAASAEAGGAGRESAAAAADQAAVAPARQPVVQLQMPEPAIVLEVGAPTVHEDQPSGVVTPAENQVSLTGVVEEALGEDEGSSNRRGEGRGRHGTRDVGTRKERVQEDHRSEDGDRAPVDDDPRGGRDEDGTEGDDRASGDGPAPGERQSSPGAPESAPVGEEPDAVSPETPPPPAGTAPAPAEIAPVAAPPSETEPAAPAAPAPEPAAPAPEPAAPAAPAPAPPPPPA